MYMDNYYNNVENNQVLLQNKITICGRIMKNRGIPICLRITKLKKGRTMFKGTSMYLYKSGNQKCNVDRKGYQNVIKPNTLINYREYVKGVDRED